MRELVFGGTPELIIHLERERSDGTSHAILICGLYGDEPWCAEQEWDIGGTAKEGGAWQAELVADGEAIEVRPVGPVPDTCQDNIGRFPINSLRKQ